MAPPQRATSPSPSSRTLASRLCSSARCGRSPTRTTRASSRPTVSASRAASSATPSSATAPALPRSSQSGSPRVRRAVPLFPSTRRPLSAARLTRTSRSRPAPELQQVPDPGPPPAARRRVPSLLVLVLARARRPCPLFARPAESPILTRPTRARRRRPHDHLADRQGQLCARVRRRQRRPGRRPARWRQGARDLGQDAAPVRRPRPSLVRPALPPLGPPRSTSS